MNPRRQKRLYITLSAMLASGAIVPLILFAAGENMNLFYTPKYILQGHEKTGEKPSIGERLRVGGLVVPGSVKHHKQQLEVEFKLQDDGGIVTVVYAGLLPDLFREGQGIVAEGSMAPDGTFVATEVLAKHDENYMPKEVAEALKQAGQWQGGR